MGRPVITATCAAKDPVVESGAGIAVDAEDPTQLAEALVDMAKMDADQRRKLGRNGRKWVMENNNFSELANKLEQVLQSAQFGVQGL